jgi:DNA polymerase III subunit beta
MKAIISKLELVGLISKIQGIVPSVPPIPILANVLIEAANDQLIISATDLTISMRAYTDAKVEEEGSITLPARRFFQLSRELTAPQVELHAAQSDIAFLNAGSSHFKIQGISKTEFPTLPDLSDGTRFTFETAVLKEMLSRTAFAAAKDDTRQMLNGILMQSEDKVATFIGTDGKRLAKIHTQVSLETPHSGSYILPIKAAEEMIKILDSKESSCTLTLMGDKLAIEVGRVTLICKLLSGQYPDVTRVIPAKTTSPISLHRDELISLLRQVALFTSDASSSVRFTFTTGSLHLSAMSGDIGEGKVSMAVNYGGPKLEIAFNPHYFLDILRHTKDETVQFDVTDSYNPGLLTDSSNALFVIMPMRLEQ